MVVRRSDSRRRRLVVDPSQTASEANEKAAPASASAKKSKDTKKDIRAYSYGAHRRNVNKTTDLFPKRTVSYLLAILVLAACLWLINYGAVESTKWRAALGSDVVSSLAITGQGSLASWFKAFLLILSSLASFQIFALRKHRCDDYRGTYRLWIWMSGVLLFASLCCVVNLGSIAAFAVESVTQVSFSQKPWLAPAVLASLLTILTVRSLYEVRRSRGSMAWMGVAWLGYALAITFQLPGVRSGVLLELGSEMVAGNCVLVATMALLMAHVTYVRFIFLRAHGLIKLKAKKKVAKPKAKTTKSNSAKSKKKSTKSTSKTAEKDTEKAAQKSGKSKTQTDASRDKKVAAKKTKNRKTKSAPVAPETAEEKQPKRKLTLQEMAAASRAKEQAQSSNDDYQTDYEDEQDEGSEAVIKMSKAQRRKQRKENKQNRNRRRAA